MNIRSILALPVVALMAFGTTSAQAQSDKIDFAHRVIQTLRKSDVACYDGKLGYAVRGEIGVDGVLPAGPQPWFTCEKGPLSQIFKDEQTGTEYLIRPLSFSYLIIRTPTTTNNFTFTTQTDPDGKNVTFMCGGFESTTPCSDDITKLIVGAYQHIGEIVKAAGYTPRVY